MNQLHPYLHRVLLMTVLVSALISCKKLVSIDEPRDTITAKKMFLTEQQTESALIGLYGNMIHSTSGAQPQFAAKSSFAAGLSTYAGGISSGEIQRLSSIVTSLSDVNVEFAPKYWNSAYNIIYLGNAVIEGIASSTSDLLRDSVRRQYTAEAKLLRAFSYLYLTNFFGDVPLVLTIDFQKTKLMSRTPQAEVYQQILEDLEEAYEVLPINYTAGKRTRVNKWAAAGLLARTHLYMGQYEQAAAYASEVINQSALFQIEPLERVFLKDSREAIFQLMQTDKNERLKNATPEGNILFPTLLADDRGNVNIGPGEELLQSFESDDQRLLNWIGSLLFVYNGGAEETRRYFSKYKTGEANAVLGAPASEYYVVLRLAEMYLIRAEARAHGADGGASRAVEDLNITRTRAGLEALPLDLSAAQVLEAVWQERQVELFAEWGHRWLDLKRSGKAVRLLSAFPFNQPWKGDWQLLYPIPSEELKANPNLVQNPGYDQIR